MAKIDFETIKMAKTKHGKQILGIVLIFASILVYNYYNNKAKQATNV